MRPLSSQHQRRSRPGAGAALSVQAAFCRSLLHVICLESVVHVDGCKLVELAFQEQLEVSGVMGGQERTAANDLEELRRVNVLLFLGWNLLHLD